MRLADKLPDSPSFFWAIILALSVPYLFGLQLVSVDAIVIPLFMNAAIAIISTIIRVFRAGGDSSFLIVLLIFSSYAFYIVMHSAGMEFSPISLTVAFFLTLVGAATGNRVDRPAVVELIAVIAIVALRQPEPAAWNPALLVIVPFLAFPLVLRAIGDYGPKLGIDSFRLVPAPLYLVIFVLSLAISIGLMLSPGMAIPLAVGYISVGHLLHEASLWSRGGGRSTGPDLKQH